MLKFEIIKELRMVIMRCHYCESDITINYGKTKAGTQRFKCTECKKTFVEEREIYTKTEKRLLSMLVELLNIKSDEIYDLKDFVKRSRKEYYQGSSKLIIKEVHDSKKFDVFKAKLVICQDGDNIYLYKVKQDVLLDLYNNKKAVSLSPRAALKTERMNAKKKRRQELKKMTPEEREQDKKQKMIEKHARRLHYRRRTAKLTNTFPDIHKYSKNYKSDNSVSE